MLILALDPLFLLLPLDVDVGAMGGIVLVADWSEVGGAVVGAVDVWVSGGLAYGGACAVISGIANFGCRRVLSVWLASCLKVVIMVALGTAVVVTTMVPRWQCCLRSVKTRICCCCCCVGEKGRRNERVVAD